jgi:putative MFS transporter
MNLRVAIAGSGGQFSDGYILGIVGITLASATSQLGLSAVWLAALGAASLAGLFLGALVGGPITDRYGRRIVFAWDMPIFAVLAAMQFFVATTLQVLIIRIALGLTLGADYVAAKTLVMEHSNADDRGKMLSVLAIAWAAGYGIAYCVGFFLREVSTDAWRWMLLSSALPAVVISPFRFGISESPLWHLRSAPAIQRKPKQTLLSTSLRQRTLVACLFYTCQVIPFFAVGTFIPLLLSALHVHNSYYGGLIYSIFLIVGAGIGFIIVDMISRRSFLVGTFYACAVILFILTLNAPMTPTEKVWLFAVFSSTLAAAATLEYVYTPELFPTEVRGSGVGFVVSTSRIGAAMSTFLLPLVERNFGVRIVLLCCAGVLLLGGVGCQLWAPETRHDVIA